jgi:hypothetical protein
MAFYYHMYICDTAFGFIQAQVHPSTVSQQISMLQLDSMYCIMLKTITTNIAITSLVRKLDALRSGSAEKLPRSDLDKKGPLCKLIRNSRGRERAHLRCHR